MAGLGGAQSLDRRQGLAGRAGSLNNGAAVHTDDRTDIGVRLLERSGLTHRLLSGHDDDRGDALDAAQRGVQLRHRKRAILLAQTRHGPAQDHGRRLTLERDAVGRQFDAAGQRRRGPRREPIRRPVQQRRDCGGGQILSWQPPQIGHETGAVRGQEVQVRSYEVG